MEAKVNTQTMMLPDFEIETDLGTILRALKEAESWETKPYECIGYMKAALENIQVSLRKAKPTKQEFYYEGL